MAKTYQYNHSDLEEVHVSQLSEVQHAFIHAGVCSEALAPLLRVSRTKNPLPDTAILPACAHTHSHTHV